MPLPAPRSRGHGTGWYVLGLLTFANFLHYGNRNVVFPMYEDLRAVFDFSNSELGLLGTAYMLPHALVSLPFGWAGDRFDKRRVIALGLTLWSVAAVASAAAIGLGTLLFSRALVGVGTAACVPLCNALLCEIYPDNQKARIVSIFSLGLFLGGVVGFGVGGVLGYPAGVLVLALPGLIVAVLVLRLDVPAVPARTAAEPGLSFRGFVRQARELLAVPTLRWVVVGATLMAFAAGGYVSWFFEFTSVYKGMGPDKTFVLFGLALVGGLMGILAGGMVADILQRRRNYGRLAAISMGMFGTVPFALISIHVAPGPVFYASSWLMMFFITWYHGPIAAVVDDLARHDRATTAQAMVLFTMHFVGTAPSSWVVGKLADSIGLGRALLVPTAAVVAAALAFVGGWRTIGADRAAARAGRAVHRTL